jgi:hypothetical protein
MLQVTGTLIRKVIEKGILAPSADNLQPWRFYINGRSVQLHLDPKRIHHFSDAALLVPYLSAGAVIENTRVAATEWGQTASVEYFPNATNAHHVATLSLNDTRATPHPHVSELARRHTNRQFFNPTQKIPFAAAQDLQDTVARETRFKLIWIPKDDTRFGTLARIAGEADQIRFENERLHRELFELIRFKNGHTPRNGDGLGIETFEAGPLSPALFRFMTSWERMKTLNTLGMSHMFNWYTQIQIKSSSALAVIVAPTYSRIDFVRGGEVTERLWHEATRLGLSLQPMEALPIFIINLITNGGRDLSDTHRLNLKLLKEEFLASLGLRESQGLVFLFRMGYATGTPHRSLRRPVDSFFNPKGRAS